MSFSAQDIALIVTTVTTALTALSGVVLPYFNRKYEKRHQRNVEIHKQFEIGLNELLQQSEVRHVLMRDRVFRGAFPKAFSGEDVAKDEADQFDQASLSFQMLGKAHGVDTKDISGAFGALALVAHAYYEAAAAGQKDRAMELLKEQTEHRRSLQEGLLEGIEKMWDELRKKYPVIS